MLSNTLSIGKYARSRNFLPSANPAPEPARAIWKRNSQPELVASKKAMTLNDGRASELCNSAIPLIPVLANMNGTYNPCNLAFATQLPEQIPDTIDLLTPETASKLLDKVMQQFRNEPPRSGRETREEHQARMREWLRQDRLARKAGKLRPLHLRPKLIRVPTPALAKIT